MSVLSKFLDRHGIDEEFRAKTAGVVSIAAVAAMVGLAPMKSLAGDFKSINSSTTPAMDTIGEFAAMATRATDRMADMQAINRALHDMAELTRGTDGDLAARIVVAIDKKLFEDTPYHSFGKFDTVTIRYPRQAQDGSPINVVISTINYQRQSLAWSANALQDVVDAYRSGSREAVSLAIDRFDESVAVYESEEPRLMTSLARGLNAMVIERERNFTAASGYKRQ